MDTGSIAFYPLVINLNGGKEDDQKEFFKAWITIVDGSASHAGDDSHACHGGISLAAGGQSKFHQLLPRRCIQ
jgi:hypothetical protein